MISLKTILNEDCWKGYRQLGMKEKNGRKVPNCIPEVIYRSKRLGLEIVEYNEPQHIEEAEYQGKKVQLGKVKRGGSKKFYVYVRDPKTGNVKKVSFGDTTGLSIKTDDPERRKSFRARHNCDNPGPKTKARYWSCRMWSGPNAVQNMLGETIKKVDGKYVVYPKKGGKRLGTHDTYEAALKQLRAIEANK